MSLESASLSDTPKTDEAVKVWQDEYDPHYEAVSADFARDLERRANEVLLPLPVGVSMDGVWLMVEGEVNVDDLCGNHRPGRVVRMKHADSLRYVPPAEVWYEHVAGMISDEA